MFKKSWVKSHFFLILLILVLGVFYRLYLSSLIPHSPVADERTYIELANEVQKHFWVAECCTRGAIYPLFLASIFSIFGHNLKAIVVAQGVLDVATGLVLFFATRKLLKNLKWAYIVLIIYTFNPLTASYTGLYLTEIMAFFSMALFFWLFIYSNKILKFLSGVSLGSLMFNRLMFFYFGIGLVAFLFIYYAYKHSVFKQKVVIFSLGMIATFIYPIISNWIYFKTISVMPPISTKKYDIYMGLILKKGPALLSEWNQYVAPIMVKEEPKVDLTNQAEINRVMDPLLNKEINKIINNPLSFVYTRIPNIFYFWDKSNLYYYWDPFFPNDRPILRVGNIVFLTIAGIGIIFLLKNKKKTEEQKNVLIITLLLMLYLTLPLSLRVAEERLTLPAYPVLLVYIPLGVSAIKRWILSRR